MWRAVVLAAAAVGIVLVAGACSTYSHGFEEIRAQDPGELTAAAHGIPVVLGTGDCGAAQHLAVSGGCSPGSITTTRATGAWDDSPWVTAVGRQHP